MFGRWELSRAIAKRVCKFMLKKKLGEVILGDIDLEQLDVQLSSGTVQLSDLALNVDFFNQKLGGASVMVKEGSVKSLSIKIPWNLRNCEIEVNELELVLGPFVGSSPVADGEYAVPCPAGDHERSHEPENIEQESSQECYGVVAPDVHEGVKTVAKIVKWFLTSFHLKLNKLIVAFEHPDSNLDEAGANSHKSLVLRIKDTEFGTCVSEDSAAKLTNFIKFQEANIEFLHMNDVDNAGTSFSERNFGHTTIPVLTGESGGFSGTVNLSIPWKNGSLDICKVDADVSVEPLVLRVQPSSIEWLITVWQSLQVISIAKHSQSPKASDLFGSNSRFHSRSSLLGSRLVGADSDSSMCNEFERLNYSTSVEKPPEALLSRAHVIHNWIPEFFYQGDQAESETDLSASVDQFFECFDGMRSFQASSGSSGIWNWTCSVFNAITVASNLASGLGDVPKEQNVETTLRAAISKISIFLSLDVEPEKNPELSNYSASPFLDGLSSETYMSCYSSMNIDDSKTTEVNALDLKIHHLEAACRNVVLDLQTYPQHMALSMSIEHIEVDELYDPQNLACVYSSLNDTSETNGDRLFSHYLQEKVQGVLPAFPFSIRNCGSDSFVKDYDGNDLIQVRSLESFGDCRARCNIDSKESDSKSIVSTSFTVHLPPFILWLNFGLVDMLLALFKQIECYLEKSNITKCDANFEDKNSKTTVTNICRTEISTPGTTLYPRARLEGHIALQQSRLIIWFPPSKNYGFPKTSPILDKFIVLELTSPLSSGEVPNVFKLPRAAPARSISNSLSSSIHLVMRCLDVYLVESAGVDMLDDKVGTNTPVLNAVKIFSAAVTNNHSSSGVTMIWQNGLVTGTWMADRAWSLSQHGSKSRNNIVGKGTEFSSVTTLKDHEETGANIRQELILSSAFLLHIKLHCAWVNLDKCHYRTLNHLLHHAVDRFSKAAVAVEANLEKADKDVDMVQCSSTSQTSFLVDCDVLDICISLDELVEVNHLIQKELPGSWNCFKLHIEKLEVFSVSNIGGITDAQLFWLKHGEGELWGSVFDNEKKASQVPEDLLLIICRDSTMRRGNGEGANVLAFGPAGTAVTYLHNPILKQTYTSIKIYCGTIIAPGGRLDWVTSMCFYFSLPLSEKDNSAYDDSQSKFSEVQPGSKASFFLDLVDVALCYEPHNQQFNCGDIQSDCFVRPDEDKGKQTTASLLAASSLSLSNHTILGSTLEYNINLKDVGLLICNSTSSTDGRGDYGLAYLQKRGFVKVAEISFLEALLRIRNLLWELEWSDSHINIESCHDTTYGLIQLIDQLQQLYAPDVKDTLVHLQSRWNAFQEAHKEHSENVIPPAMGMSATSESGSENLSTVNENCQTAGLLDEILDNAFEIKHPSNVSTQSRAIFDEYKIGGKHGGESARVVNSFAVNPTNSSESSAISTQSSSENEVCSPQIIESYCTPNMVCDISSADRQPSNNEENICSLATIPLKDSEYVRGGWYKNDGLVIVEDHILTSSSQPDIKHLKKKHEFVSDNYDVTDCCKPKGMIILRNIDVRWSMYSGNDWPTAKETPMSSLTSSGRDACTYLELTLDGLNLQHIMYPEEKVNVSKLSISVQNLHLYDRSKDAPWIMVLGNYHSKDRPRDSFAKAFKLELEAVRPDPLIPLEDYRVNIEFLPLRLHLDQTQLNFLIRFFGKDSLESQFPPSPSDSDDITTATTRRFGSQTIVEEALLPFFQKCDVKPVILRVDYVPRNFDASALRKGNYAEILNLVAWKGINLQLKHVCAVGIYGWSSLCEIVGGQWLEDIASNQVHKLLKGLPPIRSLVAVGSGTSKLVSLPVRAYKKDHKLMKGMQRGAMAFIRSISIEAVGLGVHLAAGAHDILLQAEYILTSIPSSVPSSDIKRRKASVRSNQPEDTQEGIQQAYESLSDGLGRASSALIGSPLKTYQRGAGAGSVLASAVRGAPAAAIAPISASARAVHCTLLGFRNSLDPERKKESVEKYQGPSGS